MARQVIGVMGPGQGATSEDVGCAMELGRLIAQKGYVLLSGGRAQGVMDAVNRGAKERGGLTVGVLPSGDREGVSQYVDVAIVTDMGSARNNINVLSSDVVVAVGVGSGTVSEIALALKAQRHVVLLNCPSEAVRFFAKLHQDRVHSVNDAVEAMAKVEELISRQ